MRNMFVYILLVMFIIHMLTIDCVCVQGVEKVISSNMESPSEGLLLEEAIKRRRSIRTYSDERMTFTEVSKLLYLANGITKRGSFFRNFRAAPSAGAQYPIEIYLAANGIRNLADGVYWFNVENNSLVLKKEGNYAERIAQFCFGQQFIAQAEAIFIMTAVWERTMGRYGQRGKQYIFLDAGHIAQNIYLEATSLGLAPCAIGAFTEGKINTLLGVDGKRESCVYIMVVGK